jgi:hypothetical protein
VPIGNLMAAPCVGTFFPPTHASTAPANNAASAPRKRRGHYSWSNLATVSLT